MSADRADHNFQLKAEEIQTSLKDEKWPNDPSSEVRPLEQSSSLSEKGIKSYLSAGSDNASDKEKGVTPGPVHEGLKDDHEIFFPEGGFRAWLVVAGSFCCTFMTFGYVNSFGVFQEYYSTGFLSDLSPSSISWIGSLQLCLIFGCGIFTGHLFEQGYFAPVYFGACVSFIIFQFLLSLCTEFYQFILCQGLAIGISVGVLQNLIVCVPAQWFSRRRAAAMGVMASGSSLGGVVFPIAVSLGFRSVGFGWTLRIVGFITLTCSIISALCAKTRLPPKPKREYASWTEAVLDVVDLGLLKRNRAYAYFTLGAILISFGLYTPFTYIEVYASNKGLPQHLRPYFLVFINASSTAGRIVPGFLADRWGRFNTVIPCLTCTGVLILILPLCDRVASLSVFAVLFGFCSGCYVSLIPACAAQLGQTKDVGKMLGVCFFLMSWGGLFGTPISGAILGSTDPGADPRWWPVSIYSGCVVMLGSGMVVVSRQVATSGLVMVKF